LAARADDLAITWDPSPDPTIVGYALYYAQTGCPDFTRVDLGNTTTATVSGLDGSQTYVLYTVGIYDSGQESPPSNFLTYPVPVQLIVNGSFESGYDGWTASGNQLLVQDSCTDGSYGVVFNNDDSAADGALSQNIATVPGQLYALTFDLGASSLVNQDEQQMQLTVQGQSVLLTQTLAVSPFSTGARWQNQSVVFTADSGSATLTFQDVSATTVGVDLLLDNVKVAPSN
jgi:hypothetical protein